MSKSRGKVVVYVVENPVLRVNAHCYNGYSRAALYLCSNGVDRVFYKSRKLQHIHCAVELPRSVDNGVETVLGAVYLFYRIVKSCEDLLGHISENDTNYRKRNKENKPRKKSVNKYLRKGAERVVLNYEQRRAQEVRRGHKYGGLYSRKNGKLCVKVHYRQYQRKNKRHYHVKRQHAVGETY